VSYSDCSDRERLLEILEGWKAGDFRRGVAEHNYLWEALGDTVGEAYELREQYND